MQALLFLYSGLFLSLQMCESNTQRNVLSMCMDEGKAFLTLLKFASFLHASGYTAPRVAPAGPAHWDGTRWLTVPSSVLLSLQLPAGCCRRVTATSSLLQTPDPHVGVRVSGWTLSDPAQEPTRAVSPSFFPQQRSVCVHPHKREEWISE